MGDIPLDAPLTDFELDSGWVGRFWPNGEITIGRKPAQKRPPREADIQYEKDLIEFGGNLLDGIGAIGYLDQSVEQEMLNRSENPKGKKRGKKGNRGITSYGARTVRNCAYALDVAYGKDCLTFATFTLPADGEMLPYWVGSWSEIMRQLEQELRRELERVGAPTHLVGVTEIQEKRSQKVGYPIPHCHLVWVGWDGLTRDEKFSPQWYISADKAREIWNRILANIVEKCHPLTEFPDFKMPEIKGRVNLQKVQKSVEGYLGKYLTKGAKYVAKWLEQDPLGTQLPKHWWHCSLELRRTVLELVKRPPLDLFKEIIGGVDLSKNGKAWYQKAIKIVWEGAEKLVGWVLKLKPSYLEIGKEEFRILFGIK